MGWQMYPFLQGFEQVSIKKLKKAQSEYQSAEVARLYCLDENQHLTHLLLRGKPDLAFLTQLATAESLTVLTLQNCQLSAIPDVVSLCTALTVLDLDNNAITALPQSLYQLQKLEHLSLNDNAIKCLTDDFCRLSG